MRTIIIILASFFFFVLDLSAQNKDASDLLYEAIYAEEISAEFDKATKLYKEVLEKHKDNRQACAQAIFHLGLIAEKSKGKMVEKSKGHYQTLINNFPEIGEYASLARTRLQIIEDINTFIDPRDGHKYKYVEIGDQTWMAENLAYMPHVNPPKKQEMGIWVYDYNGHDVAEAKTTENYQKYGCLYDWTTAMDIDPKYLEEKWDGFKENHQGICPPGWHIPSDQEWMNLEVESGYPEDEVANVDPYAFCCRMESDNEDTGYILKSTQGWQSGGNGSDSVGFKVLPGGTRNTDVSDLDIFDKVGKTAQFWTSNVHQDAYEDCPTNLTFIRTLVNIDWTGFTGRNILKTTFNRAAGISVRCVRNSAQEIKRFEQFVKETASSNQGMPNNQNILNIEARPEKIYKSTEFLMWIISETEDQVISYDRDAKKIISINKNTKSIAWESSYNLSNNHISESDEKLFFSTGKKVICLDSKDGTELWTIDIEGMIEVSISDNILFGRKGYYSISAIDIDTGSEIWNYRPDSKFMLAEPIIENNILVTGKVFLGRGDKTEIVPILFGIDLLSGEELWKFSGIPGLTVSKPAVNDGVVYFNNKTDNYFYAINLITGKMLWRLYLDHGINSDIAFYQDKIICYESNSDHKPCDCYIISSDGELLKTIYLGDGMTNYKNITIIDNILFIPSLRYLVPGDRIIEINLNSLEIVTQVNLPIGPTSLSFEGNTLFFGAEDGIYVLEYPMNKK